MCVEPASRPDLALSIRIVDFEFAGSSLSFADLLVEEPLPFDDAILS